jgi:hypothetical protein
VRDGRDVGDGGDLEAGGLERADRLLASATRALHEDLDLAHAMLHRALGGEVGGLRGRVWSALAGALEANEPGTPPRHDVARRVGDRDDRVVEGRLDVHVPVRHVLPLALLAALLTLCHGTP